MRPLVACLIALSSLWVVPAPAAQGDVHTGIARVVDGDTLELGRGPGAVRVRLFAVDAPEAGQSCRDARGRDYDCGAVATRRLERLVQGERLACEERDRDQYERIVAVCRLGRMDVGYVLAREGLVYAYREFSDRYVEAERAARREGLGVFAGRSVPPWEYRQGVGGTGATAQAGPRGCTIKGNIGSGGDRVYHTPQSPDWGRTRIDESRGERWFCNEGEARAAGWRKAFQ